VKPAAIIARRGLRGAVAALPSPVGLRDGRRIGHPAYDVFFDAGAASVGTRSGVLNGFGSDAFRLAGSDHDAPVGKVPFSGNFRGVPKHIF
jgi:hypothetical protein